MDRSKLSKKLDFLSVEDLGVPFDENSVWLELESRLSARKTAVWLQRVAAVVALLLISLPTRFSEEDSMPMKEAVAIQAQSIEKPTTLQTITAAPAHTETPLFASKHMNPPDIILVGKKRVEVTIAEVSFIPRKLKSLPEPTEITSKQLFAAKDISIIQASLGKPSVERGSTMAIRAQWQKSSTKTNVEYQALKIKLYEKNE